MKAIRRYLRIAPKKVNLVADLVRGKPVEYAINLLKFIPKHAAKPMLDTIKSAVANAENNFKQKKSDLYISKIVVNEGSTLKRSRPVSRGRSHPILKRTSHIVVEVAVKPGAEKVEKKVTKRTESAAKEKITPKPKS